MSLGGPRAGRGRLAIALSAAAIVVVVIAAWVLQAGAEGGAESPTGDSASPYSITVRQGGEVLKRYDLAALHSLPQVSMVIDGSEQDGPLLRTVLEDAGAASFAAVDIVGAGIRDAGRLTLTVDEVDRDVLLDFSERGTVKVCGARLDREEWVRDVVSIDAR